MTEQVIASQGKDSQRRLGVVTAVLCVCAVVWFSYLPFLYVASAVGVSKIVLFAVLVAAILLLQYSRVLANNWKIYSADT